MYLLFVAVTVLVGLATFASGVFGLLARSNVRQRPGRGQAVAATARLVAGPLVIILPLLHW